MILRIMVNDSPSQLLLFVEFPDFQQAAMIGLFVKMALRRNLAIAIEETTKEEAERQEYDILPISAAMVEVDKQYPLLDGKEIADTVKHLIGFRSQVGKCPNVKGIHPTT